MIFQIISDFTKEYSRLIKQGLIVIGLYRVFSDNTSETMTLSAAEEISDEKYTRDSVKISVMHPFVFDHRLIPKEYKGIKVEAGIFDSSIPEIFNPPIDELIPYDEYWDPDKFIRYVEWNIEHIRKVLNRPDMEMNEALDAICFGSFEDHVKKCTEIKLKRLCLKK